MKSASKSPEIVVIGGGIGGLSAAIHLAAAGARVRLYEQNERVGGKMNVWEQDGFRFDTGPHVLTMLFALQELFQLAGTSLESEMELTRLDPICRYHFPDGTLFDAPANLDDARAAIARFAPEDVAGFDLFMDDARRIYDQTTPTFLCQDFADNIHPTALPKQMRDFLSLKPFERLDTRIAKLFSNPKLRQIFNLYALYSGSDPKRCSSLLSVIAHVQWNLGTFYPRGGLYQVAERLGVCAAKLGVEITTSARVEEITSGNGRVSGATIVRRSPDAAAAESRETVECDAIVCNRDILSSGDLLPQAEPAKTKDSPWEPTPSAFLMLLGVRGRYPALAHHNSFLTGDERGEYASLWNPSGEPFHDPTIGVACQSVTDSSKAPEGCSNLFVMTNVPAVPDFAKSPWTAEFIRQYRQIVLGKLERGGLAGLAQSIVVEQIWTPNTFRASYAAWQGALYGASGNGMRQMFTRPAMKDTRHKGLFYAGGGTHPGGGVPLCALSGKIAAAKTLSYLRAKR